ncbi:MAG TPA: hypothetical protein VH107_11590 [Lacipirellulaceae bacterium]|jgi:hypothetical protein|nr:hypothetical protein [Lacipirellulaceae bacterium]
MIGQTIDARPSTSFFVFALPVISIGLVVWAVLSANPHIAIVAVLPLAVALGIWLGRPKHVVLVVEPDGLQIFGTHHKVRYADIQDVAVGGSLLDHDAGSVPALPMQIEHADGCLVVPPQMNVDRAEFYRFLTSQMPLRPVKPVPPALAPHAEAHIAKFGADKVQIVHTRRMIVERWRQSRRRWIGGSFFAVGLIWLAIGIGVLIVHPKQDEYTGWVVGGVLTSLFAGVALFFSNAKRARQADQVAMKHPDSCIVISPTGLAMSQGDLQGAVTWREIMKVTTKKSQFLSSSGVGGLQLHVRGGQILVFDIYERSLAELADIVRRNLNPA